MSAIDKAARIAAQKAQRLKEQRAKVQRLDPKFPFRIQPFNPRFFNVRLPRQL